ncbi:ribonuclease Z [Virgibacillus sp. 179-BFC.A HS]|uniref:Ribonuclease Z n=1 Tax=Tigheibacillus jepli TaxID=3035914 RepID=A0ABU5CJE1_9BACI|nr:ribonuclease Z [Virgibacillus sp. 179-BFC.A HS]MDY0405638.1 ribonuclease Z [Virgibacillus sp. 179-BFC.A HS]
MELLFLGTGAGVPSKERNVTAIALSLLQEDKHIWLFDCGEATQHQILHTTIKPGKINKIFITHLHGDHIYGLPGFLSSRSFQGGTDKLTVYGPEGIKAFIETSLTVSKTHLSYPLEIVEITQGLLFDEDNFSVSCMKLDHGIDSYGFRVVQKDKPGELLPEKLQQLGIRPGPIYQQIKENETVKLATGEILERKNFIGPNKRGKIITIMGDTRSKLYDHAPFVSHSDVLVHEATFNAASETLAKNYFHSTTTQAASLAAQGDVKRLVLTHISSRYQKDELPALLEEARNIFQNTEIANDFYEVTI